MFGRYGFILLILQFRAIYCITDGECRTFDMKQKFLNKRLKGHSFFETKTDLHDCVRYCMYLSVCKSWNSYIPTRSCELNDVDSLTVKESEFETQPGAVFSDIFEWPSTMAGSCGSRPCSPQQLCVPTEPYQCIDIKCGSLPSIENGIIELVESDRNVLLDKASIVCDEGYVPNQAQIICKVPEKLHTSTCVYNDQNSLKCTITGIWETGTCLPETHSKTKASSTTTVLPATTVPPPTSTASTTMTPPTTYLPATTAQPKTTFLPATSVPTLTTDASTTMPPTTTTLQYGQLPYFIPK